MNNSKQDILGVTCNFLGATHSFNTDLRSETSSINHTFALVFNGILIIPTILLNAVPILTVFKSSQLKSKTCYFIILVQSVVDFAVGVFGIPLFMVYILGKMALHSNCVALLLGRTTAVVMIDMSAFAISIMTLERYIAVLHPFAYKVLVTKRRIITCTCIGSFVILLVDALLLIFTRLMEVWLLVLTTVFFIFIAFVYTRIFLVVKNLARQSKARSGDTAVEENLTKTKLFLRDIKHAKSCFIVVTWYICLYYLPVMLMFSFKLGRDLNEFYDQVLIWVITLGLLNSSVNSVIFFWTKKMLRTETAKLLKRLKL